MRPRRDDQMRKVRPSNRARRPPGRGEPRRSVATALLPLLVSPRLSGDKRAALYCRCGRVSFRDGKWKKPRVSLKRLLDWCVEHNVKHFEMRLITCPECIVLGAE